MSETIDVLVSLGKFSGIAGFNIHPCNIATDRLIGRACRTRVAKSTVISNKPSAAATATNRKSSWRDSEPNLTVPWMSRVAASDDHSVVTVRCFFGVATPPSGNWLQVPDVLRVTTGGRAFTPCSQAIQKKIAEREILIQGTKKTNKKASKSLYHADNKRF